MTSLCTKIDKIDDGLTVERAYADEDDQLQIDISTTRTDIDGQVLVSGLECPLPHLDVIIANAKVVEGNLVVFLITDPRSGFKTARVEVERIGSEDGDAYNRAMKVVQ